ncbi:MAG: glycosyltransferase family 2 protein [Bosea sp. (in: a-proteobacteria)]
MAKGATSNADLFGGTPESFHLLAASSADVLASAEIAICVPTFRRPDLLEATLRSLAVQACSRPFVIIVVDNEGIEQAGATRAKALFEAGLFQGLVLVEPRQGNCKAYNAAWRCALTRLPRLVYLAGIDDDETAEPGWLEALVDGAETSVADIVGGPVTPDFETAGKEWLRAHPIFRSHYTQSGEIPQLYSSANYLIRAGLPRAMGYPFLDERFDYTGGGDTDFFSRSRAAGKRFWWAQDAAMREIMPARRSEFSWISARGIRNGMISALIDKKADPSLKGRLKVLAKSLALLAASPFRGAKAAWQTRSLVIGLYHAQVAIGRIGAEFGLSIEQYRNPEKN